MPPYTPHKTTNHPEEEICRLLAADDWRGMELMFRVYYKRLVVWADTFVEDMQLAEDIVQELFITLWEKKRRKTLQSSTLSSFLFVSLIQSEVIYLTVNRLKRIRVRCGQWIRN